LGKREKWGNTATEGKENAKEELSAEKKSQTVPKHKKRKKTNVLQSMFFYNQRRVLGLQRFSKKNPRGVRIPQRKNDKVEKALHVSGTNFFQGRGKKYPFLVTCTAMGGRKGKIKSSDLV